MRKFVVTLMTSLLSSSVAFAFWPEATDSSLEIGVGYRQDTLSWKTKCDCDYSSYGSYSYSDESYSELSLPYKLESKLKWKDLSIWQIEGCGKYVTCDNIYLRGNFDYGWITSGKNTDRDFITEDESYYSGSSYSDSSYSGYSNYGSGFEFAKSRSHVSGHVYDAKIALGYQFKMCDDSFAIAPLVGYSWHGQHFQDSHLQQELYSGVEEETVQSARSSYYSSYSSDYSYSDYSYYSYGGKHSTYHTRWTGPFIGFDFDYRFGFGCGCDCAMDWQLFGTYEFHWATYNAKGDWHLREFIDGFNHHASNAYGNVFDIGLKWDFCECWTIALKGEFQWWWADSGHDRLKIHEDRIGDVRVNSYLRMPLRDVKWDSASISLDLGMVF